MKSKFDSGQLSFIGRGIPGFLVTAVTKTRKHCIFTCVMAIFIFFFAFGCKGGNSLNGTWKNDSDSPGHINKIVFSGNNFIWADPMNEIHGTYSIQGDRIEFLPHDESIVLWSTSFSRSENVLTINSIQYTRKTTPEHSEINGSWAGNLYGYFTFLDIAEPEWTISIPTAKNSWNGTYTIEGKTGTVFGEQDIAYGTVTIVDDDTINITLNENTYFPGTHTFRR